MGYVIRSASLNGYLQVARSVGLDPDAMLRSQRLSRRLLIDPDTWIPAAAVARLLESSAQLAGAPDFGLRMAESRQLSNLGPLGLVVQQEPTLRRALEAMTRYLRLHNESLQLRLEAHGGDVALVHTLVTGRPQPNRQAVELSIGATHRIIRSMLGEAWQPRMVCFAHAAPADASTHRRLFGGAVLRFGAEFDGIVSRASDLDRPIPSSDPQLARYARQYLDGLVQGVGAAGEVDRIRHLVRTLLPSGRCTADRIAQTLGVDRRTVHRHLERSGTTYLAVLTEVRNEMAARYVADGMRPLAEVAELLGFTTQSAFAEWFRRQHGCTASAWRARRAGAVGTGLR